jgi:2-polyprenyl-3-methyl-5-hydroxy-6-metoxy-1,4-benzoquinol methylase
LLGLPELRRGLRAYARRTHLDVPPTDVYARGGGYVPGYATYSQYNYCSEGVLPWIKTAHFEAALSMTREHFGRTGAIDFGTADGFLLRSLTRRYEPVLAIDVDADGLAVAERTAREQGLDQVEFLCNGGLAWDELRARIDRERYGVMYLLETLEHVGTPDAMIPARVAFVRELLTLIRPGGTLVVSVPNMVGLAFAVQRAALAATGSLREEMSRADLAKAIVLKDTRALEPQWESHKHLGFNHRELERALRAEFAVTDKRDLVFSKVYAVRAG